MLTLYLAIAVVTIPLGAGIAFVSKVQPKHFGNIFGLTAGAVLGIVLVMMIHLYTEVGYATILVMWVGFLLISGVEYLTMHRHNENERHIDNREHRWSVNLTVLGLSFTHSPMDSIWSSQREKTDSASPSLSVYCFIGCQLGHLSLSRSSGIRHSLKHWRG